MFGRDILLLSYGSGERSSKSLRLTSRTYFSGRFCLVQWSGALGSNQPSFWHLIYSQARYLLRDTPRSKEDKSITFILVLVYNMVHKIGTPSGIRTQHCQLERLTTLPISRWEHLKW